MLSAFKVQKLSRLPRARKKIRACGGPVCDNEFVCRSKNIFPVMLKKKIAPAAGILTSAEWIKEMKCKNFRAWRGPICKKKFACLSKNVFAAMLKNNSRPRRAPWCARRRIKKVKQKKRSHAALQPLCLCAEADKKSETKKPITFRAAALVPLHCRNRCLGPCSAQVWIDSSHFSFAEDIWRRILPVEAFFDAFWPWAFWQVGARRLMHCAREAQAQA